MLALVHLQNPILRGLENAFYFLLHQDQKKAVELLNPTTFLLISQKQMHKIWSTNQRGHDASRYSFWFQEVTADGVSEQQEPAADQHCYWQKQLVPRTNQRFCEMRCH